MQARMILSTLLLLPLLALAQTAQTGVTGLWKTIDDQTGKPKSLVRITEVNGEYQGKIEKLFRTPDQDQNPKCDKCEDARKDQLIIGMTVITGMKKVGESEYSGGQILDPNNGKIYKSKMRLREDGRLDVRGYVGVPMLGRTQTWVREEVASGGK